MKRSLTYTFLILFVIGLCAYVLTPLGPKVRGYAGRLWSRNTVALKKDRPLSEKVYQWQLTGTDGNPLHFEREKGKVVFLNFWATWCGPCLKEMPDIQKLYESYGERVEFLLVTKEDTSKVSAFVKKKGYSLPIYFTDTADIPEEIASKSMPTTYIIGKSGIIARAETGATDWNSNEVRSLLNILLEE